MLRFAEVVNNFSDNDITSLESKYINNSSHNWANESNDYVKDWNNISNMIKDARNWRCEICGWTSK